MTTPDATHPTPRPEAGELAALDPFELLRKHAESRKKMTKAELLVDAEMGDEAYINMACEKDMAEAYYKDLEAELAAFRAPTPRPEAGELAALREALDDAARDAHALAVRHLPNTTCRGPFELCPGECSRYRAALAADKPSPDVGLRKRVDAVADALNRLDAALAPDHEDHGDECAVCQATAIIPLEWLRLLGAIGVVERAAAKPSPTGREREWIGDALDVERLAAAICNAEATRSQSGYTYANFSEEGREPFRDEARRLAAEYAALTPSAPTEPS